VTPKLLRLVRREPPKPEDEHGSAFIARYRALHAYAIRVVGRDRGRADDLVQDAYIQFTLTRPDLERIASVDGYLRTLIRNLHVSWIRRTTGQRFEHVAIQDYDSAELALTLAPHEHLARVRHDLIRVCEYGCLRKETTKTASVLLLRFFHGFYPGEIAAILRATPRIVNDLLWKARSEAKAFIETPRLDVKPWPAGVDLAHAEKDTSSDILPELQRAIFSTRRPPCLPPRDLASWLEPRHRSALDRATLSHIASCRECLNRICRRLGLASVDERHDGDRPSTRTRGDGTGQGSTPPPSFEQRARKRVRDVREHRPRQLRISINGHDVGVLAVESARNEVRWTVRQDELVAFAEVHSEQGLRLALLHVERPPHGDLRQRISIEMSDDRQLELGIDFAGVHPVVTVEYADRSMRPAPLSQVEDELTPGPTAVDLSSRVPRDAWWRRLWERWSTHQPVALALVGVTIVLAGVIWWEWSSLRRGPEAAQLLADAIAGEARTAPAAAFVDHRRLVLQITSETDPEPVRHEIDAWMSGTAADRAIRVLDSTGHLIAGHWTTAGATRSVPLGMFDDVWLAGLSAGAFRDRYAAIGPCTASVASLTYVVTCARESRTGVLRGLYPTLHAQNPAVNIVRAALVIGRPDLRARSVTITASVDGVEHVVSLEERTRTVVPVSEIPSDVFVPALGRAASSGVGPTPSVVGRPRVDLPSLEARVLELVDRLAPADIVTVTTPDSHRVDVRGFVGNDHQKRALLEGITTIDAGGMVTVDLHTYAEARQPSPIGGRAQIVESTVGEAPIEDYLRGRVAADIDVTALVKELTPRALGAAGRMRRHAVALNTFLDRFDEPTRDVFDASAQAAWDALIHRHASACVAALEELDHVLAKHLEAAGVSQGTASEGAGPPDDRLLFEVNVIADAVERAFIGPPSTPGTVSQTFVVDVRRHIAHALTSARDIDAASRR
jgi:DNA-directed RNA polymerase specialized sigma24 family protein